MANNELYREHLSEADQLFIERIESEADKTPAKDSGMALHVGAVVKLRAKGYSYRDIAAWFGERGVKANHVDVWRAHKNSLTLESRLEIAERDDDWREFVTKKIEGKTTLYDEKNVAVEPVNQDAQPVQPKQKLSTPKKAESGKIRSVGRRPKKEAK
jgi:hypothetical protein